MISSSRTRVIACVTVCIALVAACSGHKSKSAPTPTPTPTLTTPSSSPSTSQAPVANINPFTGMSPSKNGVVIVKIDDTANGRPQRGINQADIVYIEQVEGGLTRLMAVFNTQLPTVEAVRSTRNSDPDLAQQFGPVAYAASGGAPHPLAVLDASYLKTTINDRGGPGFARDFSRGAPYNLTANLAQIASVLHAPRAQPIGLTFSPTLNGLHSSGGIGVRTQVGDTPVRFDYNASMKRYVRVIDGVVQRDANGQVISTPNVIVQFCTVTVDNSDVDVNGVASRFTHTVGTGRMVLFRNGREVQGVWKRTRVKYGTSYKTQTGTPIPLMPGGVWIILVAINAPLST